MNVCCNFTIFLNDAVSIAYVYTTQTPLHHLCIPLHHLCVAIHRKYKGIVILRKWKCRAILQIFYDTVSICLYIHNAYNILFSPGNSIVCCLAYFFFLSSTQIGGGLGAWGSGSSCYVCMYVCIPYIYIHIYVCMYPGLGCVRFWVKWMYVPYVINTHTHMLLDWAVRAECDACIHTLT